MLPGINFCIILSETGPSGLRMPARSVCPLSGGGEFSREKKGAVGGWGT